MLAAEVIGEELTERGAAAEMAVLARDGDAKVIGDFLWTKGQISGGERLLVSRNTR